MIANAFCKCVHRDARGGESHLEYFHTPENKIVSYLKMYSKTVELLCLQHDFE